MAIDKYDSIAILKKKVATYCGLTFEGQRDIYFRQKVQDRMKALEIEREIDYQRLLTIDNDKQEWQNFINEVTINESYFFREKQQFEILVKNVLPQVMEKQKQSQTNKIKILSIPCANGCEPYSIHILLKNKSIFKDWRLEIEGSDINWNNLQKAKEGQYCEFDLRSMDPLTKATYFTSNKRGYKLAPEICDKVRLFQMNLLDLPRVKLLGPYHIIFCRNVLYYFDIPIREKVINSLACCMEDDGFLFVGQTEFIGGLNTPFIQHRQGEVVYYQKQKKNFFDNKLLTIENRLVPTSRKGKI